MVIWSILFRSNSYGVVWWNEDLEVQILHRLFEEQYITSYPIVQ